VSLPPAARIAQVLAAAVIVVAVLLLGIRAWFALTAPSAAAQLAQAAPLQQVQTTSNLYLGKVIGDDAGYLRVAGPAVVREGPAASGQASQVLVILLSAQPFDVQGDLLIARDSVVAVGNVARDSGLERAYRQAIGDLASPTATPAIP
jgi:hypothetical protein